MNGEIYGTPQDSGACIMVYRKDVFDEYGLTVPETWDEFAVQAARLHDANPRITMSSFPQNWILGPIGLVWQAGGKMFDYVDGNWYIDFTNPTAVKVFNYWGDLIKKNYVNADMWWSADWYKELDDGGTATVICGGWFPEWLQLNSTASAGKWRVALMPQWDASNPQNGEMGGSGFYVSSQCEHPEAAAVFVLWLNSHKDSLLQLHDKSQLAILWSKVFTDDVAPGLQRNNSYFGSQNITPLGVESLAQVKTAFTALPIMDYIASSQETELKKFLDGRQDMNRFLKNWQKSVVSFMKKQGYRNVIVGKLPAEKN